MANIPQKFKVKVKADAGLQITSETAQRALILDASLDVKSSTTTSTELGYLSGTTSSVQTQLTAAQSDATQALLNAGTAQTTINNHISNTTDAHDASAISVVPSGNLTSTNVQAALQEIQTELNAATAIVDDVTSLVTLSGVEVNATNLGTFTGTIIPDSSTTKGALQSLETFIQALPDPMEYKGTWNASTNTPALTDGTGNNGDVYQVTVAGSRFTPSISFDVGDKVVYNGATSKYEKWDMTDSVVSVNGQTGTVSLTTDNITEGSTNLYHSNERSQDAVGTILLDTATINLTYNDATPSISADVITQLSITSDASGIKLVNDETSPGNTKYYGTNGSGVKGFYSIPAVGATGDIQSTSFSAANNQVTPANVTGLAFANGVVRSFTAFVAVIIDATTDSYEYFTLDGIQKGASWDMSIVSRGDDSGVIFSITNAGQIQYTSLSSAGFVSNTIKFRALTLNL